MTAFLQRLIVKRLVFLLFLIFWSQSGSFVLAEEFQGTEEASNFSNQEEVPTEEAPIKEADVVSRVGFVDPKIISQEKNLIWLDFKLENPGPPETDIRYGVQLTQETTGGSILVDEFFFDEIVSVSSEQSIDRQVGYLASEFLSGDYDLWLLARQSAGQPRGITFLGTVSLVGTGKYIELKKDSCFLSIEGDAKQYSLREGVSFLATENIFLNCRAKNKTGRDIDVLGSFLIFKRSVATGEKAEATEENIWKDHFDQEEEKDLIIKLPVPSKPQAYDIQFFLQDGNKIVSDTVTAHYILAGESATITSVAFDQVNNQAGEAINLTVSWAGSAHNFLNSRVGQETDNSKAKSLKLKAVLLDNNNSPCSEEFLKDLSGSNQEEKINLALKNNCFGTRVVVTLLGKSEKILDQKEVSFKKDEPFSQNNSPYSKILPVIIIVIAFLTLTFLLFVYYRLRKKTGPLALFLLIGALCFGFSNSARAETKTLNIYGSNSSCSGDQGYTLQGTNPIVWSAEVKPCDKGGSIPYCVDNNRHCSTTSDSITTSVSTNKDEYNPREQVTVTATGSLNNTCSNPITSLMTAKASWGGSTQTIFNASGGGGINGHTNFTAPDTAGTYTINITLDFNHNPFYFKKSTSLKITVKGGAPTSCTGTPPNGTTQIMCPGDDSGNEPWLNVGTASSNCTSRKCEYYVPPSGGPAAGDCGGPLPSSSCNANEHNFSSHASPWPRNVSLTDGSIYSCLSDRCRAISCGDAGNISANFLSIRISSSATGPSTTILSWTPLPQVCQTCEYGPSGCWIPDYTPNYGSPSCNASGTIFSFNDNTAKPVWNLPVSIVSSDDWSYCNVGNPQFVNDPENPLPVSDPRNRISACEWGTRPNCQNIKTIIRSMTDPERTLTCNSTDLDGNRDTYTYAFKLKEIGSPDAEITCPVNGGWNSVSGGFCSQIGTSNKVIFRSADPRAQYQMTCEVSDNAGSKDFSYNLIKIGEVDDVSCVLSPERIATCAGESVKVKTETHPDNASVVWNCDECPNGSKQGTNQDFILDFHNASVGNKIITMRATSGLIPPATCQTAVAVLPSSCDVNFEPQAGENLGSLIPGSKLEIQADPSCLEPITIKPYQFNIQKDGQPAIKGIDYQDEPGTSTNEFQQDSSATIKVISSGQYSVTINIKSSNGDTVTCDNDFLVNTAAPEWWERKP